MPTPLNLLVRAVAGHLATPRPELPDKTFKKTVRTLLLLLGEPGRGLIEQQQGSLLPEPK